jgi:hypothetical protein
MHEPEILRLTKQPFEAFVQRNWIAELKSLYRSFRTQMNDVAVRNAIQERRIRELRDEHVSKFGHLMPR